MSLSPLFCNSSRYSRAGFFLTISGANSPRTVLNLRDEIFTFRYVALVIGYTLCLQCLNLSDSGTLARNAVRMPTIQIYAE
jgi:hypothetical protein